MQHPVGTSVLLCIGEQQSPVFGQDAAQLVNGRLKVLHMLKDSNRQDAIEGSRPEWEAPDVTSDQDGAVAQGLRSLTEQ